MSYEGKLCPKCNNECRSLQVCNCCFWCCIECRDNDCTYCKNFYYERETGTLSDHCQPPECKKQCNKCKKPNCECPCCRLRRSKFAPSQSTYSDTTQYVTSEQTYSSARSFAHDSYSPNVLPIIIAVVALIISVCVMIGFRIRPFHRVRDFCARKMNGLRRTH
ncbi:hypothetical protein BBBOND_0310660 [Babesia bigemina]|uniref:Uncharacterized protein n=1 Tax=Babesia bigemina TaxID=5866 RepID=A0A061D9D8_BABBI|nr:hypothetical protein BBBOND_0310660 [Babesia bigemina]CDR97163.1 hypothetical protein BBBOND_0310660 [Babesia bigemina]|eukprot:XP_012769349.1 hypothetical protein BBBOND_0310660 [Babesia bigemina]